jgi:hypothetical protein
MVWPHTERVIAVMADEETTGDGTVMQFPGEAMGADRNAAVPAQLSVPPWRPVRAEPQPATVSLLHATPKAHFRRNRHVRQRAPSPLAAAAR